MKTIRGKLILNFLLISIIPVLLVLILNYFFMKKTLKKEIFDEIRITRNIEIDYVENYLNSLKGEQEYFSQAFVQVTLIERFLDTYDNYVARNVSNEDLQKLKDYYTDSVYYKIPEILRPGKEPGKWFPDDKKT